MAIGFKTVKAALALTPKPAFGFTSAANPKCCHSRNHGLCASISSCRRFATEMALAPSGLVSGTANIRSRHSMSAIVCSAAHSVPISDTSVATVKAERHRHVVTARTFCTERESVFPDILCWYLLLATASACVTQFAASVTHSQIGITYFKQCAIVNTPKICRGSKF
jgi:hypothetical protein